MAHPHALAVCAIFQDEAPYLAEWIEFHRLAGASHFYLYDNLSEDEPETVLAPYVDAGLVTLRPWPHAFTRHAQVRAYDDCLARDGADCRWLALLDVDEFLFAPDGRPLPEVLRGFEDAPGVVVHWQVYGSSGHDARPEGLVIENFLRRAPTHWVRNRRLKTVLQPGRARRALNPHFAEYADGALAVNENREPCRVDLANRYSGAPWRLLLQRLRNRLALFALELFPRLPIDPYSWSPTSLTRVSVERLRINHYAIKSREEYRSKRRRRREPGRRGSGERVHNDLRFRYHDCNDVYDDVLLAWAPRVRAALAQRPGGAGPAPVERP